MKYLRRGLAALVLLLLVIAVLVWFLPARWVMPWLQPQLHGVQLHGVSGQLWNGRANDLSTADGTRLGTLRWQLSRRLVLGDLHMRIELHGPQLDFSGTLRRLPPDQLAWHAVHIRADLALIPAGTSTSFGRPQGELSAVIDHAVMQGGWPLQLAATIRWQHAGLETAADRVPLGDLHAVATADGGVMSVHAEDDGHGPLQLDGRLAVSPLGYRLDATLGNRSGNPALQRWLARLGSPDADGLVHLHNSGGLAGTLPAVTSSPTGTTHEP